MIDRPKASRWRRRVVISLALVLLVLLAVPATFFVRAKLFPPTFDVESIRETPAYQDPALLARGWALPVARTYRDVLAFQSNGSTCGPTSLADVERSRGRDATEVSVLEGTGECGLGICFGGLTLDELATIARMKTPRPITVLRDLSYDAFRVHLARFNDPAVRYVVNFHRGLLFGAGTGHFSPIGGYLEDEDLVFVLDVNEDYGPWLVPARRLYDALDSVDSSSDRKRGLLRIE